jgi:hypothetical protein
MLNSNKPIINELKYWLNPENAENAENTDIPIHTPELVTDKKNSSLFQLNPEEELEIPTISEMKNKLKKLEEDVNAISAKIKKIHVTDQKIFFSGNIVVNGDAYFQEFVADNLNAEILNDEKIEMDKYLISDVDQNFSMPLQAKTIFIENLEVPSLCGLKSDSTLFYGLFFIYK